MLRKTHADWNLMLILSLVTHHFLSPFNSFSPSPFSLSLCLHEAKWKALDQFCKGK